MLLWAKSLCRKDSRGGTRTPDPVINSRLQAAARFASVRPHNDFGNSVSLTAHPGEGKVVRHPGRRPLTAESTLGVDTEIYLL